MRPVLMLVAAFALIALLLAWSRWLAGRRWAAAGNLALALVATAIVAVGWPFTAELESYAPNRPGRAIAEVFFEQIGSERFRATLTRLPSGRMQVFELEGHEWRLSLRELEWGERATALGAKPVQRLERLESRGAEPGPMSVFRLAPEDGGDPGRRLGAGPGGNPVLTALEQASAWQPLAGGARFEAALVAGGVEIRALNPAATASLAGGS